MFALSNNLNRVNACMDGFLARIRSHVDAHAPELRSLFDTMAAEARFARDWLSEDLARLPVGAALLEVGGGVLLLSCQLAAEGFDITAIEPTGEGFGKFRQLGDIVLELAAARPTIAPCKAEDFISEKRFPLDRAARVYIAGHRGLVGSALLRTFAGAGFTNLLVRSRAELDLTDRAATFDFVLESRPQVVIDAAARVGGILANDTYPADFLSENLQIQVNLLDAAVAARVPRLLFLGSSCIYPKLAPQPIPESALLTGPLEPTNDAYAIAKIAGILAVQAVRRQHGLPWISAMPTNLYGPGDNFSPSGSHLLPALIRRYDEAKASGAPNVTNWGTGTPRRELLHVDDLASACLYLLEHFDGPTHVNVGTGIDHTIGEIAEMVASAVGYSGETRWDPSKPDGTPRKLLDVSVLREAGWRPSIALRDGIEATVAWYREHAGTVRQ